MHPQPASKFCEPIQTQQKGLGLFAKIHIEPGTLVSQEVGIKLELGQYNFSAATWEDPDFWESIRNHQAARIEKAMSDLITHYEDSPFQQDLFKNLSRSISGRQLSDLVNLFLTNCQPDAPAASSTIFGLTTSAFNHSCIANTSLTFHHIANDPGRLFVRAFTMKDIPAGTELTVPYGTFNLPTAGRRSRLRETYRFECFCDLCTDTTTQTRKRIANINRLAQVIFVPFGHEIKSRTPWLFFRTAADLLVRYQEVGIQDMRLVKVLEACASVAAYHSDAIRTNQFLTLAQHHKKVYKPDDVEDYKLIGNSPHLHADWGCTQMGLSRLEEIELFRERSGSSTYDRVVMARHEEESYDRILPEEEKSAEMRLLAKQAEQAASELLAEEETTGGKERVAVPAKKGKKKKTKKQKEKKGATGEVEAVEEMEEVEEAVGPVSTGPDVRLNMGEEGEGGGGGWVTVGRKAAEQQRAEVAPAAPLAKRANKKGKKKTGLAAAGAASVASVVAAEERREVTGWEGKGREEEKEVEEGLAEALEKEVEEEGVKDGVERDRGGSSGFSVAEAAVAGEKGALGRLRSLSQPPPCSSVKMYDEAAVVVPAVGGELARRYAAYIDKH